MPGELQINATDDTTNTQDASEHRRLAAVQASSPIDGRTNWTDCIGPDCTLDAVKGVDTATLAGISTRI